MLTIFELSNGQKYFSLFSLSPKILLIHNLTFNLGGNFTVQWDQTFLEVEKFTCYPDSNTATKEHCEERGCLWQTVIRFLIIHEWIPHKHFNVNCTYYNFKSTAYKLNSSREAFGI